MIASTCLAVLFVPAFFVVVQRFEKWRAAKKAAAAAAADGGAAKPRAWFRRDQARRRDRGAQSATYR